MTGDGDADEGGGERLVTTRGILRGIGGLGAGVGLGAGGIFALNERSDLVDLGSVVGPRRPDEAPPPTEPDEKAPLRDTPWERDTVVFSIDRADNVSIAGTDPVPAQLQAAAEFWNEYLEANASFDLTLSFEPDHPDPDVRFTEHTIVECYGEYDSPAATIADLAPYVCVETLTEPPDETPISVEVSRAGGGTATFWLVVTHALGRLVGFDVWSDPVEVMTPTILFGPSHALHPDASAVLGTPSHADDDRRRFAESIEEYALPEIRTAVTEFLRDEIADARDDVADFLDDHEADVASWTAEVERFGLPRYVEAYEETVLSDEIAALEDLRSTMTALVESRTGEEIEGSDALATVENRLEEIVDWPAEREAWDVRIHRHYTDAVWAEWAAE